MSGEHRLGREASLEAHPAPSLVPAEPAIKVDAPSTADLTMAQLLATPNLGRVEFYPDGTLRSIEFQTPPKPDKGKAALAGERNGVVPIRPEPEIAATTV